MIEIRPSLPNEGEYLKKWLADPVVLRWFPMVDNREIDDAVRIWMGYSRFPSCLTALIGGVPVGMAVLYIQPYEKFAHQCLFAILVDEKFRSRGVGKTLMEKLIEVARTKFNIEVLHLEVYQGNPAIRLYERLGFKEYGRHPRFIKMEGEYLDRILMQKEL